MGPSSTCLKISSGYDFSARKTQGMLCIHSYIHRSILLEFKIRYLLAFTVMFYWRASVASETLTGVKMKKSGMFICIYVWTYVGIFVL